MLEKEFCLLNTAYESYNLDKRKYISSEVLNCIRSKIIENKDLILKITAYSEENISLDDILNVFDDEVNKENKYKLGKNITKLENKYAYGVYTTSIGNIVVECSDTLTVLRYFIEAIKSRNTITISDCKYSDVSLKSALLIIFCEALSNFNIDMNLIMLIPYEECYYEKYDRLIYADKNKTSIQKKSTDKLYIYLEDDAFKDYVEKEEKNLKSYGKECEILTGEFYDVISKINENISEGASIYTKNADLGFKFLNLVHSKNVFVNSSLIELETVNDFEDELYMKKKVVYPLDDVSDELDKELKITNIEKKKLETNNRNDYNDSDNLENKQLVKKEVSHWYTRIFECLKNFIKGFKNKNKE